MKGGHGAAIQPEIQEATVEFILTGRLSEGHFPPGLIVDRQPPWLVTLSRFCVPLLLVAAPAASVVAAFVAGQAVVATERPVVLVGISGRPLALECVAAHCATILIASVPGDAGPEAIVDILSAPRTRAVDCRSRCRATSDRSR